jgi:hypothetical protein
VYAAVAPATPDYQRAGTAIVTVLPSAESGVPAGQAVAEPAQAVPLARLADVQGELVPSSR